MGLPGLALNTRSDILLTNRRELDGRKVYPCQEYSPVEIPLSEVLDGERLDIYPEVTSKGYFNVTLKGNRLVLSAGEYIGLIPINSRIAIDVSTRVPVGNLERAARLSGESLLSLSPFLRSYTRHLERPQSLLDLFTEALVSAAEMVGAYGLYREYQQRAKETGFPRGRIKLGQTIRIEARGIKHRVAASWFEQTVDNGPNRCLKYAIWYLAQHYARVQPRSGDRQRLSSLNQAYRFFDGVHLDLRRDFLRDSMVQDVTRIPPVRSYYQRALPLALAVIRDEGVAFNGQRDEILMASFLLRMSDVFEGYLRATLRNSFARLAPELEVLNGNHRGPRGGRKQLFDTKPSEDATPDIVIRSLDSARPHKYPLLVEVKYKTDLTREDVNQAITYGVSFRAPVVVLTTPRSQNIAGEIREIGRIGTLTLFEQSFNLAARDIVAEEQAFCSNIRARC